MLSNVFTQKKKKKEKKNSQQARYYYPRFIDKKNKAHRRLSESNQGLV